MAPQVCASMFDNNWNVCVVCNKAGQSEAGAGYVCYRQKSKKIRMLIITGIYCILGFK